jgi:hypothetical protein
MHLRSTERREFIAVLATPRSHDAARGGVRAACALHCGRRAPTEPRREKVEGQVWRPRQRCHWLKSATVLRPFLNRNERSNAMT